ncbi:MAG: thiosulfate/3-mercaptopyruvate sulfurtransferase [Spirochaetes bacterium]|nr:MAG: thiosulfate/3-mercaptopyruvate sulfurtransferase [Spirochaetota bacterium]
MKKGILILLMVALVAPLFARDIDAVVTADWLEANLSNPKLAVIDVRKVEDYKAAHIPGALSLLGSTFYVPAKGLSNELPFMDDLSDALADAGIGADSLIVVVETDGARFSWATRVAWTLAYAGLENVAVLSGGQAAWVKANKPVTSEVVKKAKAKLSTKPKASYLALKADVLATKGQVVDARTYDTYFGLVKQGFVAQAGHLPGAYPLPFSWITNADGLVKSKDDLAKYAATIGLDPSLETIIYCDSGVLCTSWWWIMKEYLGWANVRSYDGSSQEITADPSVKYVPLVWR